MPSIAVIVNPHARSHRGHDHAASYAGVLGPHGTVHVTPSPASLGPLVERWLTHEMPGCIVCDGGDGALHCVLNAVWPRLAALGLPLPMLLPTGGGTINFVSRKVGLRGDAVARLRRLVRATRGGDVPTVPLDTLEVRGACDDGRAFRRLGFAMAAGGVGQRFFDRDEEQRHAGPAAIVTIVARAIASLTAGALPGLGRGAYARALFRPHHARVVIDGRPVPSTVHGALNAGAIDVELGGIFRVFDQAGAPGSLHFQAGTVSPTEMVANLPALLGGHRVRARGLVDGAGERMEVEALGPELPCPVIDGERFEGLRRFSVVLGPTVRIAVP